MRAIQQTAFGGPEVLRLAEVRRPEPMGTEALVRVRAAGVNPVDWVTRAGKGYLKSLPLTVGWDVSGVVEATGGGVTRFAPGDEVFGMPWFPRQAAAYAEYVTAPSRQLARKPPNLNHREAAGLPLAGLTAWQVLVDTADIQPGQRILITGAAGGVGHLAVQIASARGAYVIATASAAKHDFVRALGADEVIDYTSADPAGSVSELDVEVPRSSRYSSRHSLADLGHLVGSGEPGPLVVPAGTSLVLPTELIPVHGVIFPVRRV
jgi:NADPH:quinone reductase-like Zn-dependent oxidoreductase